MDINNLNKTKQDSILKVENITKTFPGVKALDNVYLDVKYGECIGLCGENGAGKSTLMNIISGVYKADSGRIIYKGEEVNFNNVLESQKLGISIIHQELNLIPHLSVFENIYLGREIVKKNGIINFKEMMDNAKKIIDGFGVDINVKSLVKDISVAKQQMVEIAKALSMDADVIILDEPTSSLTEEETKVLFKTVNQLKEDGKSLVYISHKFEELEHIVDRIFVFRDGKYICHHNFSEVDINFIISQMVGREISQQYPQRMSIPKDNTIFEVNNLRSPLFEDISFNLHQGEILGLSGLVGAGRTEIAKTIFGAYKKNGGSIKLHNKEININSPFDAVKKGIAYLPEDRKLSGLAIDMNIMKNITLSSIDKVISRFGFISTKMEESASAEYVDSLDIKTPSIRQSVRNLSGGNQQKVVLGKWLFRNSSVLICDEPTRGIDVGAKFNIYKLLDELASKGIGIIYISSDLPEILGITDRVLVVCENRITATLDTKSTNQNEIMEYSSGVKNMYA